ncbi:MAG TPA: hypothetical protein VGB51_09885 [Actinomycetota bacterium]
MPAIRARLLLVVSLIVPVATSSAAGAEQEVTLGEFTVSEDAMCDLRDRWVEQLLERYPEGTWAPMEFRLNDAQLATMGLPSAGVLASRDYPTPTLVSRDGRTAPVSTTALAQAVHGSMDPAVASYAGIGCLGIRPGAWLLIIDGGGISLCSMAHVYGGAGAYDISTAGHCGKGGATATVIAAVGNRSDVAGPVLLDFGRFSKSTDGGLGRDYALIDIDSAYQHLVTPTMCFWGGPRGTYAREGGIVEVDWNHGEVSVTPDPFLAQPIVHYGHGLGIGTGGTPRAGAAIHWGRTHFMFSGAIVFGDSGSGANTVTGDAVGANLQAAGIITHIYVDPLMRDGVGIMGGTRATAVSGSLANGQYVPYPLPLPGFP